MPPLPRSAPPAFLALLAAGLALAGCLGAPGPAADAQEAPPGATEVAQTVTLAPWRGAHEVNLEMAEGASVAYAFTSTQPLAWDVHSHDASGSVRTWAQGRDAAAQGTFTAPEGGVYSLYLRNEGGVAAEVSFEIEGAFTLRTN